MSACLCLSLSLCMTDACDNLSIAVVALLGTHSKLELKLFEKNCTIMNMHRYFSLLFFLSSIVYQ